MGRWMEVLRERPPIEKGRESPEWVPLREGVAPHPLLNAAGAVRSPAEAHFPALYRVRLGSPEYEDEELWLSAAEAESLLADFRRLRAVCRRESFIPGLDGAEVYGRWRGAASASDFERQLDDLDADLALAVAESGVVLLAL